MSYRDLSYFFEVGRQTFLSFLNNFEVAASKFNLECPLTSMASKTSLSNILKEASNQCILPKIDGSSKLQVVIALKPILINVLSSEGYKTIVCRKTNPFFICPDMAALSSSFSVSEYDT